MVHCYFLLQIRLQSTSSTSSIAGSLNIVFNSKASIIDLKSPSTSFLIYSFFAISKTASSLKINFTFSNSKSLLYCLSKEFFGSCKIFTKELSSSSSSVANIGTRPTNSGINPYLIKSSGSKLFNELPRRLDLENVLL